MKSTHGQMAFDRVDQYIEDGQFKCRKGKACNGRCIPKNSECQEPGSDSGSSKKYAKLNQLRRKGQLSNADNDRIKDYDAGRLSGFTNKQKAQHAQARIAGAEKARRAKTFGELRDAGAVLAGGAIGLGVVMHQAGKKRQKQANDLREMGDRVKAATHARSPRKVEGGTQGETRKYEPG